MEKTVMPSGKILIVDDDQIILDVLARRTVSFGFDVSISSDGKEAVEKLQEDSNFKVVLTDIKMPRMDGIELVKYIRQNHPEIKVIVMTGFRDEYSEEDVLKAGAVDYIEKPFLKDELQEKLLKVIKG